MRIATFDSLESAQSKLDSYNSLARHITSPAEFSLTEIRKHTTEDIWWFNVDDCVENGGVNRELINNDVVLLNLIDITEADLINQGYSVDEEEA